MAHDFKNKLHIFISEQIPDFITAEYPQFVTFLEKYYEFLDTDNQVHSLLLNSSTWNDIDETLDSFIQYYKAQYAPDISGEALLQNRRLIKYIFDYYEGKGSENSVELFFRFMYNEKATVSYPGDFILRASDGRWSRKRIVKIDNETPPDYTPTYSDPFELQNKKIKFVYVETIPGQGRTLKSVETSCFSVVRNINPTFYELEIDLNPNYVFPEIISAPVNRDINGDGINETIPSLGNHDTHIYVVYNEKIYGTLTKQITKVLSINEPGENFRVDDAYKISETGVEGLYFAQDYAYDTTDGITSVELIDGGSGYSNTPTITITDDGNGNGEGAVISATVIGGVIQNLTISTDGFGYVAPENIPAIAPYTEHEIIITDGTGIGASANITIEPGTYKPYVVESFVNNGIIRVKGISTFDDTQPTGILELQIVNTGQRFTARELSFIGDGSYFLQNYVDGNEGSFIEGDQDLYARDVAGFVPVNDFTINLSPRYPRNLTGTAASITFQTGIIYHAAGTYKDSSGFLSDINYLQDNYYYQPYSYVIQSQKAFNEWKDTYLTTNHPAGFRAFAQLQFIDFIDSPVTINDDFKHVIYLGLLDEVVVSETVSKTIGLYLGIPYFAHINNTGDTETAYYTDFIDTGDKYVEDDITYPKDEIPPDDVISEPGIYSWGANYENASGFGMPSSSNEIDSTSTWEF